MKLLINPDTENPIINLVIDTLKKNKQALIFVNTKKSAEKTAEDIAKKIKNLEKLEELSNNVLNCISKPTKQCERLAYCVKTGIAFHHSGLVAEQRKLIEENFRSGAIKIICATTTLAFGVDLPAYRTIIKDLRRYGYRGMTWIPVLEFLQMAGRSGRPKYDTEGQAICVAISEGEKNEISKRYIEGMPEEIDSKLAVEPVLRTYLLSLISANFISTKEEIVKFFKKTFWAFHFKDMERLIEIIDKMLELLQEWEFITSSECGAWSAELGGLNHKRTTPPELGSAEFRSSDELIEEKYRATLIGKRVAELYIDPYSANYIITCLKRAKSHNIVRAFPLLQMVFHTNELRPLLGLRQKDYEKIEELLVKYNNSLLEPEPNMYDFMYEDFLDSVKTAMVFHDWIEEEDEEYLLEEYNVRPGELKAKLELTDWMLFATEELARMNKFMGIITEIKKLRIRLKYGVKEELITLLRLEGIGRVRARKLYANGVRNLEDVKKADLLRLTQILGEGIAKSIKKQVDQEIKPVALGKRRGQINLEDY